MQFGRRQFIVGAASSVALTGGLGRAAWAAAEPGDAPVLDDVVGTHGYALYNDLKYGPDFSGFDYANPTAPKGGRLVDSALGSFDSFNPFILRGSPADNVDLIFDTLTVQSQDEPFSRYGLVAQHIFMPADRRWVAFDINPAARWHDGTPILATDIAFTFDVLRTKGSPLYQFYYRQVAGVDVLGERRVRFNFVPGGSNRELPLVVGQLPVLPAAYWSKRDFEANSLDKPLSSGPYRIKNFDPGRSVTYERVPDYWAADLPVNRGRYNFAEIRSEYFRDLDVSLEAFKAGQYDYRFENSAKRWMTGYGGPALDKGEISKLDLMIPSAARMQGFAMNIRRSLFADPRVREAIGYCFDFEWSNKTLFYGQYERIRSYFHGHAELMATGLPSKAEQELLAPFKDALDPRLFTNEFELPRTDGTGNIRDNLRKAFGLLKEAGWEVKNGSLTNVQTGQSMAFEILLSQSDMERVTTPFVQNLSRLGIKANIRTVDPSQYQNRMTQFDFDVTVALWPQSSSPGNEQAQFWSSAAADTEGSQNFVGIKNPAVDAMSDKIVQATTRSELETAVRALDRALLWGFYVVPHYTLGHYWLARWNKLAFPETLPTQSPDIFTWWDTTAAKGKSTAAPAPAP